MRLLGKMRYVYLNFNKELVASDTQLNYDY